ncbi:uncharacterized protein LOC111627222 [Centruroides sculpturatus]|uniref:uncharacterized protein LOC111627222 n=1 Tax=Centruroides sculpturatus TaxID=218467 RepID=UPI000C6D9444|nr:uncharacterized protein LOC111627222 [Centruroides sculpturatus]
METKVDNLQIEAELLGLLFIEPALIDKVRGYLQVEDFEQEKHRVIYQAILQLLQDNVEIEQSLVLQEILNTVKTHQTFQNTTAQTYLSQLIDLAGIRTNLDKYVREIAKRSQRRKIKAMLKRVNQKITDERQDPDDLIQEFQREISQSRSFEYRDFVGAEKIIERTIYEIEQKVSGKTVSGLPTDFPSFDELTLGFQNGDLIIVAARPSMGKTAFALNVATNIAKHKRVGIFSLEMSSVQLFNRILASFSFIHGNKIRHPKNLTPNETRKMYVATREIKKLNL